MSDEIESLYHYGVKGMRWGRRKARDSDTPDKQRRRPLQEDDIFEGEDGKTYKLKNPSKKTSGRKGFGAESAKTLTDAELRARINRIEMEQKYAKLNKVDYGPAIKFVGDILGAVITNVATDAATAGVKRAASSAWEKKGASVAAQALDQVVRRQITAG